MNLKELKELIELVAEKEFAEFEMERSGFRVRIKRQPEVAAPVTHVTMPPMLTAVPTPPIEFPVPSRPMAVAAPATDSTAAPENDYDLYIVKSPIVGTFYRAASPSVPPFVEVGSRVERGSVLCIVEAMKLMNEIESDTAGVVVTIYVENGQPIEYGQPLFGLRK